VAYTVDVIVPVFGNWRLTAACLASMAQQTAKHRMIVVDDKSPDDTLERLSQSFPDVDVLALERNSGFAAACNRGIRAGDGDIVVLLNNDVTADRHLIERLVEPFSDPAVGSVAPLLIRPDGRVDAFGVTADTTVAGFVRLHGEPESHIDRTMHRLLGPYGAVAAYRRAALDEVGLLDEGIFMYGEELDLALRLSAAGWRPEAVRGARAVHLGGATAGRGSAAQRERAGFGRGYLLRAYRVLRSRHAARAVLTEIIVSMGDAVLSRDFAAARGRIRGWKAGARAQVRPAAVPDIDKTIGLVESLALRLRK
jgi:N-acetylglucosaminyl-diphospho-decaprenol L-rhamnosyltransferase